MDLKNNTNAFNDDKTPYESTISAKYEPGSEAEKRLLRKIDVRIVPSIWVLYVLSYLDRANIGNAREAGMGDALGLSSNQYSIVLLVFFVSYVVFEVPSNMILSRVRPSIFLSCICILWGGIAACMGAVNDWKSLAGVRFCLGVVEAAFAPGVAFYLSSWYKRHEIAKRFAIYYTATAISGAFSGLLAGVISENLEGARGIAGWRWLFIIEGVASSFVGFFTWMIMPDWPTTTRFLSEEEKSLASQRLLADEIGNTGDEGEFAASHWAAVTKTLKDWRTLILCVMYMLSTGAQTIQYFIPLLVGQLGYEGYHLQYMTIPIYAVTTLCIIGFCFLSDRMRERGHWITITSAISTVSFIIIASVNNDKAKYAFLCFAVGGIYAACPLTLLWAPNIISHPAEKRAVAVALVNSLGNSASIYGAFLWPTETAPRYIQGFSVTAVFVFLLAILAQVMRYLSRKYPYENIQVHGGAHGSA